MHAEEARRRALDWLNESCWPLWASAGADPRGGFREKLSLQGAPVDTVSTRTRVQARQIYVYCAAARAGWPGAEQRVDSGLNALLCARRSDGLYALTLMPGQGIVDDGADLYDQAFALFALSHAYGVLQRAEIRDAAYSLHTALQTHMLRPPEQGGYFEELGSGPVRQQNHHMHLFESYLAAFEHLADDNFADATRKLGHFVARALIDPDTGAVHELALPGETGWPEGDRLEAGHQFEWYWLLSEAKGLGIDDTGIDAGALIKQGRSLTRADGRVALSHSLEGSVREEVFRSWVQTEALKAYLAAYEAGEQAALDEAVRCVDLLFEDHLLENGGWVDQRHFDMSVKSDSMPASTGYHVVLAIEELNRVMDGTTR